MKTPLSIGLVATLCLACAPADPEFPPITAEVVESPAGEGSGEPFLSPGPDGPLLSWLQRAEGGGHDLRFARWTGAGWTEPMLVESREDFFVNWADFPSVSASADGMLWAHWLEKGGQGTYDYSVRVVNSTDDGATWSPAWTPHEDGTPTEHGFVSVVASGNGVGLLWLDGRETAGGHDGEGRGAMTLRFRQVGPSGEPGPERLVDDRVCDCCQTSMVETAAGMVAVYRNRTEGEIRDIYVARQVDGVWQPGVPVHDDGWEIGGCPVNGPALATVGDRLAVAWFTAAGDEPRVKLAYSDDGGASFGEPIRIDSGNPAGRVHVISLASGGGVVTWLERTGGEAAEIRMRRFDGVGTVSEPETLVRSSGGRSSGFPRVVEAEDGTLLLAWTEVSEGNTQVRVTRVELDSE